MKEEEGRRRKRNVNSEKRSGVAKEGSRTSYNFQILALFPLFPRSGNKIEMELEGTSAMLHPSCQVPQMVDVIRISKVLARQLHMNFAPQTITTSNSLTVAHARQHIHVRNMAVKIFGQHKDMYPIYSVAHTLKFSFEVL